MKTKRLLSAIIATTITIALSGCSEVNSRESATIGYDDTIIYSVDNDRTVDNMHYIDGTVSSINYIDTAIADINDTYSGQCIVDAVENLKFYLTCTDI